MVCFVALPWSDAAIAPFAADIVSSVNCIVNTVAASASDTEQPGSAE